MRFGKEIRGIMREAINDKTERDIALLRDSAFVGDADAVQALIAAGASVNVKDDSGATPIHYAAKFGYAEIARALIAAGIGVRYGDG